MAMRMSFPRLTSALTTSAITRVCASPTGRFEAAEYVVTRTAALSTLIPRADEASADVPMLRERFDSSPSELALGGVMMVNWRLTDAAVIVSATYERSTPAAMATASLIADWSCGV